MVLGGKGVKQGGMDEGARKMSFEERLKEHMEKKEKMISNLKKKYEDGVCENKVPTKEKLE